MPRKKVMWLFLLTFLLFGTSLVVQTFALYDSNVNGDIVIKSAIPITKDNMEATLNFHLDDMIPGTTKTYNFSVTNYNNNQINEVTMNYKIKILKSNNIPVNVMLYKNGSLVNLLNADLECLDNILNLGVEQTDNYQLVINWNIADNDYTYSGLTDYLDVKIESVQVVE